MRFLFYLWMIVLVICLYLYDLMPYRKGWKIKSLNLDEVYLINLDSNLERYRIMSFALGRNHIPYKRFSAVNGEDLLLYNLMKRGAKVDVKNFNWSLSRNSKVRMFVYFPRIPNASFIADSTFGLPSSAVYGYFTPGELGCFYSHRAVWCDVVKNKHKVALILEDDVSLSKRASEFIRDSMSEIPQDADLILMDFWEYNDSLHMVPHRDGDVLLLPGNKNIGVLKDPKRYTLGAYAYMVTLKGAKKLLTLSSSMKRCVDIIFMEARSLGKLKVYFLDPISFKHVLRLKSDIGRLGRERYAQALFTPVNRDIISK